MPLVRKVINNQVASKVGTILNIPCYLYLRNDNNFDVGVSENDVYQVYRYTHQMAIFFGKIWKADGEQ